MTHQGTRWGQPCRLARLRRVAARTAPLIPGIVLLLADGYGLGRLSLWRDEAYTLDAIQRPLLQIFAMARHIDAVITPYHLLMHAWIAAAGTSATALRLPSVLAMTSASSSSAGTSKTLLIESVRFTVTAEALSLIFSVTFVAKTMTRVL